MRHDVVHYARCDMKSEERTHGDKETLKPVQYLTGKHLTSGMLTWFSISSPDLPETEYAGDVQFSASLFTMCEMDKIAWQKPFSSASDFAIKKSKKIHIFLI